MKGTAASRKPKRTVKKPYAWPRLFLRLAVREAHDHQRPHNDRSRDRPDPERRHLPKRKQIDNKQSSSTPVSAPNIVPLPPSSEMASITAAAKTVRMSPLPWWALIAPTYPVVARPPTAARLGFGPARERPARYARRGLWHARGFRIAAGQMLVAGDDLLAPPFMVGHRRRRVAAEANLADVALAKAVRIIESVDLPAPLREPMGLAGQHAQIHVAERDGV